MSVFRRRGKASLTCKHGQNTSQVSPHLFRRSRPGFTRVSPDLDICLPTASEPGLRSECASKTPRAPKRSQREVFKVLKGNFLLTLLIEGEKLWRSCLPALSRSTTPGQRPALWTAIAPAPAAHGIFGGVLDMKPSSEGLTTCTWLRALLHRSFHVALKTWRPQVTSHVAGSRESLVPSFNTSHATSFGVA